MAFDFLAGGRRKRSSVETPQPARLFHTPLVSSGSRADSSPIGMDETRTMNFKNPGGGAILCFDFLKILKAKPS
ncbi:hypothetical protein ABMY26_26915 [Azospirillum sp. HJ39]|uniref:hypothetical protein n=1 Tax=Azospirillum sp. HJ39 TaxID=3159496 RepID=UPI00355875CF